MDIEIQKGNLHELRSSDSRFDVLESGEARLAIESFGLSANNITYGVMGDAMSYWQFFPVAEVAERATWGRLPVWGFAHVVESREPGLPEGTRVFGYFPMATEMVVQPGRYDASGFSDIVEHRADLPSVYNRYAYIDTDSWYIASDEGYLMLLRPLFITSFVVDDFIGDHDLFEANTMIISSASAKTAIGAAHLLAQRDGVRVVGLTSAANVEFVKSLGCYDSVLRYDEVETLGLHESVFIDVAGRRDVTHAVHRHLGEHLRYSMIVGDTHWDSTAVGAGDFVGPRPTLLFAPDQITKRRREWGRDEFEEAVAEAWHHFVAFTKTWMHLREADGLDAVVSTYHELLNGRIDPRVGDVCTFDHQ